MKTLRFEGYSDDTFGEDTTGVDHDNCANGKPMVFKVSCGDTGLFVWGHYNGNEWPSGMPACWMVGVQQLDEDVPLPSWPMRFETADLGYSPVLVIEAPDGVTIEYWNNKGDE